MLTKLNITAPKRQEGKLSERFSSFEITLSLDECRQFYEQVDINTCPDIVGALWVEIDDFLAKWETEMHRIRWEYAIV